MPGFNKMGPNNEGPATGRGLGLCSGNTTTDKAVYGRGRGGVPYGCGRGRGMGRGRGLSGNFFPSGKTVEQTDITP